jgi:hypothetical protein
MAMILLDWARMGTSYCVSGAVVNDNRKPTSIASKVLSSVGYPEGRSAPTIRASPAKATQPSAAPSSTTANQVRMVRTLLARYRQTPVRNAGWSSYLMDGHSRWESFELIGLAETAPEPPHLEDISVRSFRSRKILASPEHRQTILAETAIQPGDPIFGVPLVTTRSSAYLLSGTGHRSLATLMVPFDRIRFEGASRLGAQEPDMRVWLPIDDLGDRLLPEKDNRVFKRCEAGGTSVTERANRLNRYIEQMGGKIAVRLGLSRAFQGRPSGQKGVCWLMADGFFSFSNPQT